MQDVSTMQDQMIGVWELDSYKVTDENQNVTYPLGEDATGIAIYHRDGYMSVQMMSSGRPAYAGGDIHVGTPSGVAAAARGYLGYSGAYRINEDEGLVEHDMEVSLNPNWVGDTQPRYIQIKEDVLTISSEPVFIQGKEQNTQITWKRIRQ